MKPLRAHFTNLDGCLLRSADLWRPRAFVTESLEWRHSHAELYAALLTLDDATLVDLKGDDGKRLQWFSAFLPDATSVIRSAQRAVAELMSPTLKRSGSGSVGGRSMSARKAGQIDAFADVVPGIGCDVLDWCSGKGHFARRLSLQRGVAVTCLEIDQKLCSAGENLARQANANVTFECCDVLDVNAVSKFSESRFHTALHACGDLHPGRLRTPRAEGAGRGWGRPRG